MGLVCGTCGYQVAQWAESNGFGLLHRIEIHSWVAALVGIAALDLVAYLWHRANHVFPILWRFHRVHHSDSAFTTSTALRFHPGELLLALPVRLACAAALGLPVPAVLAFEGAFAVSNFLVHSDIALPPRSEKVLQKIFITPALHRRHHGMELSQLSSNFSTIFSLWDRWLGTLGQSDSSLHYRIGLSDLEAPTKLADALALPFGSARHDR